MSGAPKGPRMAIMGCFNFSLTYLCGVGLIYFQYVGMDHVDGITAEKWIYKTHKGKYVTNTYTFYASGGKWTKCAVMVILDLVLVQLVFIPTSIYSNLFS